jgi:hypothetical protein
VVKYFLLLATFFGVSCTKEQSCENCIDNTVHNATIVFGGPLATDGCGWLVKTDDGHTYHPDLLNVDFQHDQLPVRIAYRQTSDTFICGIAALEIPVIHLISIKL